MTINSTSNLMMADVKGDMLKAEKAMVLMEEISNGIAAFSGGTLSVGFKGAATLFSIVGAVLSFASNFLPDKEEDEMLKQFRLLQDSIHMTRRDIDTLGREMKYEFTKLHYKTQVYDLLTATDYCVKIAKNKKNVYRKKLYKKKLLSFCNNERCQQALNVVFRGIGADGLFHNNILNAYYKKTFGDRNKINKLSTRLIRLFSGGLIAVMAYETSQHGVKAAKLQAKDYQLKINNAIKAMKATMKKCKKNFKYNMKRDLEVEMDHSSNHQQIAKNLQKKFSAKYDWLMIVAFVYKDIQGGRNHKYSGSYVDKLHFEEKNAVIFYRPKKYPFRNANRVYQLQQVAAKASTYTNWLRQTKYHYWAHDVHKKIKSALNGRGAAWWGIVVIKRHVDLQISFKGSDNKVILNIGPGVTFCVLLK